MAKTTYPTFGTKLAQNPNYGRPSPKKLRQRTRGWLLSIQSWKLLRQIHTEIGSIPQEDDLSVESVEVDPTFLSKLEKA